MKFPWKSEKINDKRSLRIGFFKSNVFFPTSPANARAVQEAKNALEI